MIETIANGIAISLAAYVIIMKLGIRKLLSNSIPIGGVNVSVEAAIDTAFTLALFFLFQGTYGGTMSAIIGGLVLSLLLFLTRLPTYKSIPLIVIIIAIAIGVYTNVYS